MHADFSVELGRDDATLELPWSSADPAVRYYDLKNHPGLVQQIPEAVAYPELGAFLTRTNAAGFPLATAKCDAWLSREVAPEEEIFGDRKFVSYIDLVFEDAAARCSFERHEAFAKTLCRLLSQAPEIPAAVEVAIRRCYYYGESALPEAAVSEAATGDGDGLEKEFKADIGAEARDAAEAGEAADVRDGVETGEVAEASDAADAGPRVETRGATEANDATEIEHAADAKDVDQQPSGVANRESAGQGVASERTEQQADVGHGMKYESHADAGQRAGADTGGTEAAEGFDETVADETVADERARLSGQSGPVSGFCFTAYVTGFGDSDHEPRLRWQIALALLQNALVQLARG